MLFLQVGADGTKKIAHELLIELCGIRILWTEFLLYANFALVVLQISDLVYG